MKATSISVYVLRFHLGDCTNGGVTGKENNFTLFNGEKPEGVPDEKLLKVVRRWEGTPREYVHCEPVKKGEGGKVIGPMAGGNFVFTSDGRYAEVTGVRYPISVHDRFETQEDYDANFD